MHKKQPNRQRRYNVITGVMILVIIFGQKNITLAKQIEVQKPSIEASFEEGELVTYTLAQGKDMSVEFVKDKGIAGGESAALVTINNLAKVDEEEAYSSLDFRDEAGFDIGRHHSIRFSITNPMESFFQMRVKVTDVEEHTRIYYFTVLPGQSRECSITEFGAVPDFFTSDGFFGASETGIDTSNIKEVSFFLWENMDEWKGNNSITSAQYIIDEVFIHEEKEKLDQSLEPAITFPTISFEDDEEVRYSFTNTKDMEVECQTEYGVTEGKKAGCVKINQLSKDTSKEDFSELIIADEEGFNVGTHHAIAFDVENPHDIFLQVRAKLIDIEGHTRTYYFSVPKNSSRECVISEFGSVEDSWGTDGFYGAADTGIDPKKIKMLSIFLWETEPTLLDDPNSVEINYILDNIHIKDIGAPKALEEVIERTEKDRSISFEEGEECVHVGADATFEYIQGKGVTDGASALNVNYGTTAWPSTIFKAPAGEKWNLDNKVLLFDVTNPENRDVRLCIKLTNGSYTETTGDMTYVVTLPAGSTQTVNVMASAIESTELGMRSLAPVKGGVTASMGWGFGNFDVTNITQIEFWLNNDTTPVLETNLIYDSIVIGEKISDNVTEIYANLVDSYGQYTRNTKETKIKADSDFVVKKAEEEEELQKMMDVTNVRDITKYWGLKDESMRQTPTGHYYVKKIGDTWSIIDPLGYPYISTGLDIIRLEDASTWVTSREFMFENIPAQDSELGDHYNDLYGTMNAPFGTETGKGFNFYTANLERKYGEGWKQEWIQSCVERFKAWGFSSMGCWADPDIFYGKGDEFEFPYVAHAWINVGHERIVNSSVSDPFDPAFKAQAVLQMKDLRDRGINEDPYCMGVFVDNEIWWGDPADVTTRYALINNIFSTDSNDRAFAKKALVNELKTKYDSDIGAFNKVWETDFESFTELDESYVGKIPNEDASYCMTKLVEQYYSVVSETVEEYLGNKMYLGSRIATFGAGNEVVEACAKYADIVSFNCYSADINQAFIQLGTYDKPVIIGEFHFTANDNNNFAASSVTSQKARGEAYRHYMEVVFENKQVVGAHWFQYYDQPIVGRAWDGENYNCGFVDVTDQPYTELVEMAKEINEDAYKLKFNKVLIEND